MNRRGFLQLLGAAPVAGPSVVKEIAAGLGAVAGAAAIPMPSAADPTYSFAGPTGYAKKKLSLAAMRMIGIPPYMRERWRWESKRNVGNDQRYFDPDIQSMKSWSLSYKKLVMQQRYLDREEEDFWNNMERSDQQEKWHGQHGVWW